MWLIKIRGMVVGNLPVYDPKDDIAIRNEIYQRYSKYSFGTLKWTDIEIVEEKGI